MSQQHSNQQRSSLLWNIVQPGDPYDIRKSMIARLPQHDQNSMANNLQIVCLMQAAQIERISIYLQDFKLKYREIDRIELDRHSYEIQIKQLTQKQHINRSYYQENQKLKDFIKRLTIQLDQFKQKIRYYQHAESQVSSQQYQQVNLKYQALLLQLQQSRQKITFSQKQSYNLKEELKALRIRYDHLQRDKLKQLTAQRQKYQLKIKQRLEIQIRQINSTVSMLKSDIQQFQSKLALSRQQIQSKNYEISALQKKIVVLENDLSIFNNKSKQLEDINYRLITKSKQLQSIFQQYQQLEQSMRDVQKYCRDVENDRQREANKVRGLEGRLKQKQQQILILQEERVLLVSQHDRKNDVEHLENKLALLSSQVERLNYMLDSKTGQISTLNSSYQNLTRDSQQRINRYQRDISTLRQTNSKYERDFNNLRQTNSKFQRDFNNLRQTNSKNERDIRQYEREINALRQTNSKYERDIHIFRQSSSKYQRQLIMLRQSSNSYQRQLSNLKQKNSSLQRQCLKLQSSSSSQHHVTLQRIKQLQEQIRRLHTNNKLKQQQIYTLQLKIKAKQAQQSNNLKLSQIQRQMEDARIIYRRELHEKQTIILGIAKQKQKLEQRINENNNYFQKNIKKIEEDNRHKNIGLQRKLQEVQEILRKQRTRIVQLEHIHRTNQNHNTTIHKLEYEYHSKIKIYEEQQNKYKDDIRAYLQNQNILKNRIKQLEVQIQRLHADNSRISRKQRDSAQIIVNIEKKYLNQNQDNAHSLVLLKSDNEKLILQKKKLRELLQSAQHKLIIKQQQIVSGYQKQIRQYEEKIQYMHKQNHNMSNRIALLQHQSQQLKTKYSRSQKESQQHYQQLYKQQLSNKQAIITSLQRQLSSTKSEFAQLKRQTQSSQQTIRNYKDRLLMLSGQLQRLKNLLNSSRQQLNRVTQQNQSKQNNQQIQIINKNFEAQKNKLEKYYMSEIAALTAKITHLQRDRQTLQITIRQQQNKMRSSQINTQQLARLQQELSTYRRELEGYEIRIKQLQGTIKSLTYQVQLKNKQINNMTIKLQQKQTQPNINIDQQLRPYKIQITNLKQINKELEQIHAHTVVERDQLFRISHQLRSKLQQRQNTGNHQNVIKQLNRQNQEKIRIQITKIQQYYERILQQTRGEISRLKDGNYGENNKYQRLYTEKQVQFNNLNQKFQQLYRITHEQQGRIKYLEGQNQNIHRKCAEYQRRVSDLVLQLERITGRIKSSQNLQQHNVQLHNKLKQYEEQLQLLQAKVNQKEEDEALWASKYEKLYYTYQQVMSNHEQLHEEYNKTQSLTKQYQIKLSKMETQIFGVDERMRKLIAENQSLRSQLNNRANDEQLLQKNRHLSAEIDRLNIIIQSSKYEVSELRLRQTDQVALQKRVEEYMALMVVLFAEIETLRNRVTNTEKQCEDVRRSSLTPYRVDRTASMGNRPPPPQHR